MTIDERRKLITEYITQKKSVTNKELLSVFFVSESTLRRDLTLLEKKGVITRTHGGAILKESLSSESSLFIRSQKNVFEKKRIAQKCVEYIKNDDAIFIDSSSTVGYLMPLLDNFRDLTIITNGINNAIMLSSNRSKFSLHIAPGIYNSSTYSVLGIDTINYLKNYHCNVSIFSCGGISTHGVTEPNHEQSNIKREMLKRSKLHILLVDHTKFDKIYMSQTCKFDEIDIIITDKLPLQKYIDIFKENKCELVVV